MTKIDTELADYNLTEMARTLAATDDYRLIQDFLYSLFTPAEADEIAKRWALVKRIAEGATQRAIAAELGLSLCKITRGSRELKRDDSPFRKMLEIAGYEVVERKDRRRAGRPVRR
jgi:TrpR family trp operon transcriptional repressor